MGTNIIKIFDFMGSLVSWARVEYGRYKIEHDWLYIYDFSDNLVFQHTLNDNNYSWRAE